MAATAEEAALAAAEEAERLAVIANEKRAAALALRETTKNRNAAAVSPAHVSASFSSDAAIYAVAALLASVVFSAYYATLCPSVPGGDAGELIQVAVEGGVVHPPGYPTWTMLAYAFAQWIPQGEPAWRINLSSAVFGALASFFLSAGVGLWVRCAFTGALAGGAFAFAPLVWEYAVQGEVFALNNLNNALLLYLLVLYERWPSLPRACAGACMIGLAMCNQHTIVFFCAPYALWALVVAGTLGGGAGDENGEGRGDGSNGVSGISDGHGGGGGNSELEISGKSHVTPLAHGEEHDKRPHEPAERATSARPSPRPWLSPGAMVWLVLAGLIGLSPYLYLPFASGPHAAWGSWGEHRSLSGFLTHVLRREYGTFRLANVPEVVNNQYFLRLGRYLRSVPSELPLLGAPLCLLGVASSVASEIAEIGARSNARERQRSDQRGARSRGGKGGKGGVGTGGTGHGGSKGGAGSRGEGAEPLRRHGLGLLLPLAYLLYVLVFNYLSNLPASSAFYLAVQQRFWPQAHLLCAVWYALGLRHALAALAAPVAPATPPASPEATTTQEAQQQPSSPSPFSATRLLALPTLPSILPSFGRRASLYGITLPAVVAALVLAHRAAHYEQSDMSRATVFRDFGISVLEGLPASKPTPISARDDALQPGKGSPKSKSKAAKAAKAAPRVVLLTLGDEVLNAVRYAHRQLGVRTDVTVLDLNYMQYSWWIERAPHWDEYRSLHFPGANYGSASDAFFMSQLLDANYGDHLFFVCGGMHPNDPTWQREYRLWPLGMSMQILRRSSRIRLDKWARKSAKLLPTLQWHAKPVEGAWTEVIANNHYLQAYTLRPYYVLNYGYEALQTMEYLQKQAVGASGPQQQQLLMAIEQAKKEAHERFLLSGSLYEEGSRVVLNGSRALPDYYYRNWGVAYTQLMALEASEEGQQALKQRTTKAFLTYLSFSSLSEEERTQVEQGVMSLIPPPRQQAAHTTDDTAAVYAAAARQVYGESGPRIEQQQQQQKKAAVTPKRKKKKKLKQ